MELNILKFSKITGVFDQIVKIVVDECLRKFLDDKKHCCVVSKPMLVWRLADIRMYLSELE